MKKKLLKVGAACLLAGALVLGGCSSDKSNEPLPDSVIASVPTATPTFTPTPTPIKPIEESVVESYEESMPPDNGDDMDVEVNDGWMINDGDADDDTPDEPYDLSIVEDDEYTDQGAEGNTAVAIEIVDVYSEPGGDPNTIIGTIDANERVTVQGNVDGWFVINFEGTRAYVNGDLFA